jgi:predicted PurR-regulated permease PerM
MAMVMAWLSAYLFTQVVECPIYLFAQRDSSRRWRAQMAIAFAASGITHPIVWFVIPPLWMNADQFGGYWTMVAIAEVFAVVAEGAFLWALGLRRALLWALLANVASAGLGLLSRSLFGWP